MPKLVVVGTDDPQMSHSDEALTARRIGAPPPVFVPGWHLTMIASPGPVAAAIDSLGNRPLQAGLRRRGPVEDEHAFLGGRGDGLDVRVDAVWVPTTYATRRYS